MIKDKPKTQEQVIDRLKTIFRKHIGRDKAIINTKVFKQIYGINADDLDFYERKYKWECILRLLRACRKDKSLFVVIEYNRLFVLKTTEELEAYRNRQDAHIKSIENLKTIASEWVRENKWREI